MRVLSRAAFPVQLCAMPRRRSGKAARKSERLKAEAGEAEQCAELLGRVILRFGNFLARQQFDGQAELAAQYRGFLFEIAKSIRRVCDMQRAVALRFYIHILITGERSEEHTSELQSLMRISYAVFCLKKKNITTQ